MGAEPIYVLQSLVNGIYPFVPGCMSTLSVSRAVEHHQSLLSHGHIHSRRLPYHPEIHLSYILQQKVQSSLSGHFFLCGG